jgi:rhodanese-related sulfurtransferase
MLERDDPIQSVIRTRQHAVGRIFPETAFVMVVGIAFAFAANQISPRGLMVARNYFPTGTNNVVRMASTVPHSGMADTNSAATPPTLQLAVQMKQVGLQLIDGARAVQLFRESHSKPDIAFVDARDEEHYQAGHIPGAYEFDPYHPEKFFPVIMPVCQEAEKIVVYCEGGDCDDSETAALLLKDVGIPSRKLFVYEGGITEWTNNRLPIETGGRNSKKLDNPNP